MFNLNFVKMKKLENYDVTEMNAEEIEKTEGGFWVELWGGINFVSISGRGEYDVPEIYS